jgi:hypothetical protein
MRCAHKVFCKSFGNLLIIAAMRRVGAFMPRLQDHRLYALASDEMGIGISLQGSNPAPPMSALGQKQTLKRLHAMSALPPIADIRWLCAKSGLLHCSNSRRR